MNKTVLVIIVISIMILFYGGIALLKLNAYLKLKKQSKKNNNEKSIAVNK